MSRNLIGRFLPYITLYTILLLLPIIPNNEERGKGRNEYGDDTEQCELSCASTLTGAILQPRPFFLYDIAVRFHLWLDSLDSGLASGRSIEELNPIALQLSGYLSELSREFLVLQFRVRHSVGLALMMGSSSECGDVSSRSVGSSTFSFSFWPSSYGGWSWL